MDLLQNFHNPAKLTVQPNRLVQKAIKLDNQAMTKQSIHFQSAYVFPEPKQADPAGKGVVAVGADLQPSTLLHAYSMGLFPWFNEGEPITWWSPDPRCVVYPQDFMIKKSLKKTIKKSSFMLSVNKAFDDVMTTCAHIRAETEGTWITDDMIKAYHRMHRLGFAYSIEVWDIQTCGTAIDDLSVSDVTEPKNANKELVGGLYGLKIGNCFFGESMFHKKTDASKMAFAFLNKLAKETGVMMIDCQVESNHLISLGAVTIKRQSFLDDVTRLVHQPTPDWQAVCPDYVSVAILSSF